MNTAHGLSHICTYTFRDATKDEHIEFYGISERIFLGVVVQTPFCTRLEKQLLCLKHSKYLSRFLDKCDLGTS